jgi:formate dehydrogenase subunit delta
MSPDKLAYMANQIGKFFLSQEADKAAAGIADPRMRVAIFRHLDSGGPRSMGPRSRRDAKFKDNNDPRSTHQGATREIKRRKP